MANIFSTFLKKKLLKKDQNLISLEEPYDVIKKLLADIKVEGILDAGASHGKISERMLKNFPGANAYAFEPNPMYKNVLTEYAARESRFHPQFMALSNEEGTASLNITESAGNTSLLTPSDSLKEIDPEGSPIKEMVDVPIVTIDDWVKRNGSPSIELMKFDIQGYELVALDGAKETLRNSTKIVYSEIWFNCPYEKGANLSSLDIFLREQGFELFDIYKPKYKKNKSQLMWANAIFIKTDLLKSIEGI